MHAVCRFEYLECLPYEHGIIHNELLNQKEKKIYILSTHFHPDHFNPDILTWKQTHPDLVYILSKDILRHKRATAKDGFFLKKGDTFDDGILTVKAYGSTDSGDSFHIQLEGMSFFHAGDLNNWHWIDESTPQEAKKAEGDYLAELGYIKNDITNVDVTMAVQEGARFLEKPQGGKGILMGGVPGVKPAKVLVLGAGHVGFASALIAAGMGADVTITDINLPLLRSIQNVLPQNVHTLYSTEHSIRKELPTTDMVVGSVLIPGDKAPHLITRDMLQQPAL